MFCFWTEYFSDTTCTLPGDRIILFIKIKFCLYTYDNNIFWKRYRDEFVDVEKIKSSTLEVYTHKIRLKF